MLKNYSRITIIGSFKYVPKRYKVKKFYIMLINKNFLYYSYLRIDSFSFFIQHSNIIPGSRILLFDNTKGLVLGTIAKKLDGKGNINYCMPDKKRPLN